MGNFHMLRKISQYGGLLIATALLCSTLARAEEEGAAGIKLGAGSRLVLTLDSGVLYNSNFFYQSSSEESAVSLVVKPAATLLADHGNFRYQLGASAEAAGHDIDGDRDDYLDTMLKGSFEWNPLTRHSFGGDIIRRDDHDPFGTQRTESTPAATTDLDEWEETGGGLLYRFGAPAAKINLEVGVSTLDRAYTTNRAATRFLDYDVDTLSGTAFYNVSSKTALVAQVISSDINYDDVFPGTLSRAGDLTRYRVGARWQATGKTSGDVRVGRLKRDFDDAGQKSFSATDWEIGVNWSPRARDVLRLSTGRDPLESYINDSSLIDSTHVSLSWAHDWTALLKTKVTYSNRDYDFQGISRQDDVQGLSLDVDYAAGRKWSLYGALTFEERDSDFPGIDYDTTMFMTGIRLVY